MTQRESRLSRKIINELRKQPSCFCFKVWGNEQMMAGLPDIIGCYQGKFFAFETKTETGRVSRRQEFVHTLIARAGGCIEVVHSVEEAVAALPK